MNAKAQRSKVAKKKCKGDEEMGGDGEMNQGLWVVSSLYLLLSPYPPLHLYFFFAPLRLCVHFLIQGAKF